MNTSKGRNFAAVGILKHKKHMEVTCHLQGFQLFCKVADILLKAPDVNVFLAL